MNDRSWYYMDKHGQREGPVGAAELVAAFGTGDLLASGLVWCEGMPEWLPFSQCRQDLGLASDDPDAVPPIEAYAPPRSPLGRVAASGRIDRTDIVYAGFMRRWAALILDKLILMVPLFLVFFVAGMLMAVSGARQNGPAQPPQWVLLIYVVWFGIAFLYYALQESSEHQATLGKRAMGIKVTDEMGRRLTFGQAAGRWFAAALSYMIFYAGFLMAAFTDRKRALHDMVAGTLVVDRWAYTEFPDRQKREASGCLIFALIVGVGFVPFVAILAAIAIPAYQDYVIRSQVSEGAMLSENAKTDVAQYYFRMHSFPVDNAEAGLPAPEQISGSYVTSVAVVNGVISATYGNRANPAIAGQHLSFAPHPQADRVTWTCNSDAGTTVNVKYRATLCRP